MKHGIDNLIEIIENYLKGVQNSNRAQSDAIKQYKPDAAQVEVKSLQASLKAFSEKQAGYFAQQIADTIEAVKKDQSAPKYLSDAGFANAVQIISAGGARLGSDVIQSLARPYLNDYVARQSLAAILSQQGRDPKTVGIVDGADPVALLEEVRRNSAHTFTVGQTGADFPMTSEPSVIVHNLKKANAILEGEYTPETVIF